MGTLKITDEQQAIVESTAPNLVVNAFAGTGKTTTLVAYAQRRPNKRFTYLAFNRSIKEEAARKFPGNVRCVTTHGLAYGVVGARYKHKLGSPRPYQIAEALNVSVLAAGKADEVLKRFLASADPELHERHMLGTVYNSNEQGQLFDAARRLWARMQDVSDDMLMPHDGYLKLYQLSNPIVRSDVILFDEVQDANPITTALVMAQPGAKVMVGDAHQSIYGFRGAVNAMASIRDAAHLDLTKSFRFGAGVANVATALLHDWKDERRSIHGLGRHETVFSVDLREPHAKLARTNGELFRAAVSALSDGRKFGYVGGIEGYRLDAILDTYSLYAGKRGAIRDPWIKSFEDFSILQQYASSVDDKELKMLSSVVEEFKGSIPSLIDEIKARAVKELTGKEIALATVHKAKGLEFDAVVLMDDFAELAIKIDENGQEVMPDAEEINILYVAATRAERCLSLNDKTLTWLDATGRNGILRRGAKAKSETRAKPATRPSSREESIIRPFVEPEQPARRQTVGDDNEQYLSGFALGAMMALQKIDRADSVAVAAAGVVKTLRDPRLEGAIAAAGSGKFEPLLRKYRIIE